ncbi:hypothetical protein GOBAR_AA04523 [Gossypium barbadense]|uniref:MADS-box domain-containing protein n=1 Tax=Gossypium barbadense TaxID=3634 RepID=A0A2P5YKG2_GOSBA|nr:hypothetical protein GOBAR_AA04523 [Gossypium barbadense]
MARKKVKLAWIENNSTRKASLKKKRLGLVKKVESTTLSLGGGGISSLEHHLGVKGPSFSGSSSAAPDHGLPPFKAFSEGQF